MQSKLTGRKLLLSDMPAVIADEQKECWPNV
jgi:hypothetical protein